MYDRYWNELSGLWHLGQVGFASFCAERVFRLYADRYGRSNAIRDALDKAWMFASGAAIEEAAMRKTYERLVESTPDNEDDPALHSAHGAAVAAGNALRSCYFARAAAAAAVESLYAIHIVSGYPRQEMPDDDTAESSMHPNVRDEYRIQQAEIARLRQQREGRVSRNDFRELHEER